MWQAGFSLVALPLTKSLAASSLALRGGSATKKVPEAPGYTREFLYELPGPTVGHLHLFLKK